jgi:hypothetical protein
MNKHGSLTLSAMVTLATAATSFWEVYGVENPGDLAFRHVHWQKVLDLDTEVRRECFSKVDLSRDDAAMAALLYGCVVLDFFTVRPLAEPGKVALPPSYTAIQAGLYVFFERGSWRATWNRLEDPALPSQGVRVQLFAITQNEDGTLCYRDLLPA